jgi:hypothetical protein
MITRAVNPDLLTARVAFSTVQPSDDWMRDTALSEAIDTLPTFDRERTRLLCHEPQ